jgi:hypothetical protein
VKWKPLILLFILAAASILGAVVSAVFVTSWGRENRLTRKATNIQAALEIYKQHHGWYPESLAAASIPEPDEIYYQRKQDGSYDLWYGKELGESEIFRPPERKVQ